MQTSELKVGDKVSLPANYRGESIPVLEWTVVKENRRSFGVVSMMNGGQPNWRSFNLLLNKATGKISA